MRSPSAATMAAAVDGPALPAAATLVGVHAVPSTVRVSTFHRNLPPNFAGTSNQELPERLTYGVIQIITQFVLLFVFNSQVET